MKVVHIYCDNEYPEFKGDIKAVQKTVIRNFYIINETAVNIDVKESVWL